ncbi:transcriptional regulator, TraR/DksA family [Cnuella takakiae]|uniref:Transcriptional regulator, TraR/DksA family n=1 Tax=Cnuella takakiae TaxID=1302690 RepID=A0A1M5I111_9BACT|nr:TraR/DksA C4-type zinc finger protein [Cnuella takakiae]SHG21837.1 transcriptional regulator, TraR/DksA family [Cnuella takakiae]
MATKKAAPKKAAAKAASPAKKVAAQPAKAATKTAAPKVAPAKKAVETKAAPKKAAEKITAAPAAKKVVSASKQAPAPVQKVAAKAAPAKKEAEAEKPMATKTTAAKTGKEAPAKVTETEVVKPAVAAPSTETVKPAIKPLAKPAKKESAKPFVVPKTTTTRSVKYEPEFTKSVLDTSTPQEPTGPSMRYSDAELQEFRDLINRKLDTAKKELAYLQGLITRKDESGDLDEGRYMTMEDGSMSMEREQLSQMASRQIQFIDHLEKAIMRIENKTYGVCRVTGKLIDKARLRAVPHATLSIEAKQMMNK